MTAEGPCRLLVLQNTPFCPVACSYCYLPDRTDRRRMSAALLDRIGAEVLTRDVCVAAPAVVWHAGEPLALPASWYDEAIGRLLAAADPAVSPCWGLQTSGVGLDERWLSLIRRHRIGVGVSLDGPADLHDRARVTRGGKGTHALALRAVRRLQDVDLPFHVITVLTRPHLAQPDRLFDFYLETGIRRVCFNVEEIEGVNRTSSLDFPGVEQAFRAFLQRFLARWAASPGLLWVREIEEAIALIAGSGSPFVNEQAEPLAALSIAVSGEVASFSPELLGLSSERHGTFAFGNLLGEPFAVIAARIRHSAVAAEIASGVAACRAECGHFPVCGGGAPVNKLAEHGRFDATETLFCRLTRKVLFDVVLEAVERGLSVAICPRESVAGP